MTTRLRHLRATLTALPTAELPTAEHFSTTRQDWQAWFHRK